jgi:biotin carboxyl carrier protein
MRSSTAVIVAIAAAALAAVPAATAAPSADPAPGSRCLKRDVGPVVPVKNRGSVTCRKVGSIYKWVGIKGGAGQQQGGQQQGDPNVKPVLTRLPVTLAAWSGSEGAAGSVLFTADSKLEDQNARDPGVIYPSGRPFSDHPAEPSLTFRYLDPQATVVSPLDGTVIFVRAQPETCDSEVFIAPKGAGSGTGTWQVGLDHVRDVLVKQGQTVRAGTPLGKPGPDKNGCQGPYRVELQINKPSSPVAVCPLSLFPAAAASAAKSALARLMTDWNAFAGREVHNATEIAGAGCLAAETRA